MRVADLLETSTDPLVRAIRRILRKRQIERGIACILSAELPQKTLQPIDDAVTAPGELSVLPNFRVVNDLYLRCYFVLLKIQFNFFLLASELCQCMLHCHVRLEHCWLNIRYFCYHHHRHRQHHHRPMVAFAHCHTSCQLAN